MQFDLTVHKLTKFAATISFLLGAAVSQSAETEKVDFNFATPNGNETVRAETKIVESGEQQLAESGMVYIAPEVLKSSEIETVNYEPLVPLQKGEETLGFFTKARWIKNFKKHERAYITTISIFSTGLSIVVGQVVAGNPITLDSLASIPLVMAFSLVYRYFYNDVATFYNYRSWTPKQFKQARALAKQYLETGVRPAELKDASAFEQLVKMYLMEVTFMGLTSVGGSSESAAPGKGLAFILTSIAYTLTTTYDMIIAKRRDEMIAKNPQLSEKYKRQANFASIGAAFVDNVAMMDAKNGGILGTIVIWAAAVKLNVYHFGWDKLQQYFGVVPRTRTQCAALF